jgi:hypothetical protein
VSKRPQATFGTRGATGAPSRVIDPPRVPQRRKKAPSRVGLLERSEIRISLLAGAAAILAMVVWGF